MSEPTTLYLDGGVLLNVFATGKAEEILRALPYRCATLSEISHERIVLISLSEQSGDQPNHEEMLFNSSAIPSLEIRELDTSRCQVEVVSFAVTFPDIYAKLLAAVSIEGAALATDDECVRRFVRAALPNVALMDTPELVSNWQRQAAVREDVVSEAVQRITMRAQFEIVKSHPLRGWWDDWLQKTVRDGVPGA